MPSRTLFISTFAPVLNNGRDLRTYTVVKALAQLGPVDLAYVQHVGDAPAPQFLAMDNLTLHEIVPSRGLRRGLTFAAKLATGAPRLVARSCSPEVAEAARRLAAAPDRGRIVAGDV